MRRVVIIAAVLLLLVNVDLTLATNGYQLIGVGSAQKAMGGAVTAYPIDVMTAVANPAGMGRVGSRADFSMEAFLPARSLR